MAEKKIGTPGLLVGVKAIPGALKVHVHINDNSGGFKRDGDGGRPREKRWVNVTLGGENTKDH